MLEGVGLGVGLGVGVMVGLTSGAVGVGVGVGNTSQAFGPRIPTVTGAPVLKKPIVAFMVSGGLVESNRKLYSVPQRIAFAFWFWAKVSVFQLTSVAVWFEVQAALLNPAFPTVPSFGNPG